MTAQEFNEWAALLAPSRRQFCEMIGIARRSGDNYSTGASPVPKTVALAIAAIDRGISPAGSPRKKSDGLTA